MLCFLPSFHFLHCVHTYMRRVIYVSTELLRSLLGGLGSSTLVDRWRENLAVILANRVQGDVKVIGQLGDILWSTQMRVAAAHFW